MFKILFAVLLVVLAKHGKLQGADVAPDDELSPQTQPIFRRLLQTEYPEYTLPDDYGDYDKPGERSPDQFFEKTFAKETTKHVHKYPKEDIEAEFIIVTTTPTTSSASTRDPNTTEQTTLHDPINLASRFTNFKSTASSNEEYHSNKSEPNITILKPSNSITNMKTVMNEVENTAKTEPVPSYTAASIPTSTTNSSTSGNFENHITQSVSPTDSSFILLIIIISISALVSFTIFYILFSYRRRRTTAKWTPSSSCDKKTKNRYNDTSVKFFKEVGI